MEHVAERLVGADGGHRYRRSAGAPSRGSACAGRPHRSFTTAQACCASGADRDRDGTARRAEWASRPIYDTRGQAPTPLRGTARQREEPPDALWHGGRRSIADVGGAATPATTSACSTPSPATTRASRARPASPCASTRPAWTAAASRRASRSRPTASSRRSLTNVARHAHVANARVWLGVRGTALEGGVEDAGAGCDPARLESERSVGMAGMRERAQILGGRLTVVSDEGQGRASRSSSPALPRRRAPARRAGAERPRVGVWAPEGCALTRPRAVPTLVGLMAPETRVLGLRCLRCAARFSSRGCSRDARGAAPRASPST